MGQAKARHKHRHGGIGVRMACGRSARDGDRQQEEQALEDKGWGVSGPSGPFAAFLATAVRGMNLR